jgi:hypothetical protein
VNYKIFGALVGFVIAFGSDQIHAEESAKGAEKAIPALMEGLAKYQNAEKTTETNLKTFDALDFDVFSNQKWDRLHESHADGILVHYPDGHTTKGLHDHIDELRVSSSLHPTRISMCTRSGSAKANGPVLSVSLKARSPSRCRPAMERP